MIWYAAELYTSYQRRIFGILKCAEGLRHDLSPSTAQHYLSIWLKPSQYNWLKALNAYIDHRNDVDAQLSWGSPTDKCTNICRQQEIWAW